MVLGRRPSVILQVLLATGVVWFLVVFYLHLHLSSLPFPSLHSGLDSMVVNHMESLIAKENSALGMNRNSNTESNKVDDNPWFGWQPPIDPVMKCSWRECFPDTHSCSSCRDTPQDWGEAPAVSSQDWIPDVTMLKRMYLQGHDADGNPWPPSLDGDELCQDIGPQGGNHDTNRQLIEGVPIQAKSYSYLGPKVLCLTYTMEEKHATNIRAIRETWAPGCDGYLAFSTKNDPRIPAISLPHDGIEEYSNMWQKVRSIWRFVGRHYAEDFDFFYLGGEDLYVLPENLRNFLSKYDSAHDFFLGRRFKGYGGPDDYFNSGGAGYVLSRSVLQKLSETGLDHPKCNPSTRTSMEDVMIASCLRNVFGIHIQDTRDDHDRERFHPFSPGHHFTWRPPAPGQPRDWYQDYNQEWGLKLGLECCAPDSVSFHYIKRPAMTRHIHKLLYHCPKTAAAP